MISFVFTLAIFLVLLFYLAMTLSLIIKRRCECEEYEYVLKKAFERLNSFALGVMVYQTHDVSGKIKELIDSVRNETSLAQEYVKEKALAAFLSLLELSDSDCTELEMLSSDIEAKVDAYNDNVDRFNAFIFSFFVRPVGRMCRIRKLERIS